MRKNTWRLLTAASLSAPLVACGTKDTAARNDSASGTVAMSDSANMMSNTTTNASAGAMDPGIASFVVAVNQAEIEAGRLAGTKARNGDVKDYAKDMVDDHTKALKELQELSSKNGWPTPTAAGTGTGTGSSGNMGAASGTGTAGTGSGTGTGTSSSATATTGGTDPSAGGSMTGAGSAAQGGAGGMMAASITQLQQSHDQTMAKLRSASGANFDRAYIDAQVGAHQQALDILRQHATSIQNTELRDKITTIQKDVEDHLKRAQEIAQKLGGAM